MNLAPRGGEALKRVPFPALLDRTVRMICSIGVRHRHCRRPLCRRTRVCTPPRHAWERTLFRCRFDDEEEWRRRAEVVAFFSERLRMVCEEAHAARRLPSPFASPVFDHLDSQQPFDVAKMHAALLDEDWVPRSSPEPGEKGRQVRTTHRGGVRG